MQSRYFSDRIPIMLCIDAIFFISKWILIKYKETKKFQLKLKLSSKRETSNTSHYPKDFSFLKKKNTIFILFFFKPNASSWANILAALGEMFGAGNFNLKPYSLKKNLFHCIHIS